jgi:hypothetical protein
MPGTLSPLATVCNVLPGATVRVGSATVGGRLTSGGGAGSGEGLDAAGTARAVKGSFATTPKTASRAAAKPRNDRDTDFRDMMAIQLLI